MSSKATLRVVVVGAQGLRKADVSDGSDPYCVCEVVGKTSKKFASFRTPAQKNTSSPVWNHAHEFESYSPGDALKFTIFDKDAPGIGDDLLGRVQLDASRFYPGGFRGMLPLLEAGRGAAADTAITVTIEVRRLPANQVGASAVANAPSLVRERTLVELRRESNDIPWGVELEGPWITVSKILPESIAGHLVSETSEDGKPLGLVVGDTVLRVNGAAGNLTTLNSQFTKEQRLLEVLVQRRPRRDAEVQADSVTFGYPEVGVQAAGALVAITANTFVAHLPLKSEQIAEQEMDRIAELGLEEKYMMQEKRLRQELSEAATEIAALRRQIDRERREAKERVARMEEALKQSRLTYGGRLYAVEATDVQPSDNETWLRDLADVVQGRHRQPVPETRPTPAKKATAVAPRQVPQGASREDLAFCGERQVGDASLPDLHSEVQRLEERLLEVRREAGERLARETQQKQALAESSQEIPADSTAAPAPPAAMFRMVLQQLYESESAGGIDALDAPQSNMEALEAEEEFY